jgi:hypothetical protein
MPDPDRPVTNAASDRRVSPQRLGVQMDLQGLDLGCSRCALPRS